MKKKIIPLFVCLMLAFGFALYGCGGDSFSQIEVKGNQDTSYTVYSNGGGAVQYGNYIYFINGYSGYEDTDGKNNVWPNVVKGGLYRAELCGDRDDKNSGDFNIKQNPAENVINKALEFVTSSKTDVDEYNREIDVVDVQLIAPKRIGTSGYKDGGIFIYDEWVYFASPNNEKNKAGVVQYNKTDFFRARLDGKDSEKIYTTQNDSADGAYAFYKYNGAVYLVAQDGKNVISKRIDKKVGDTVTIAQNVTKVVLPYSKTYYKGMSENTLNHFVFIQREVGDGDTQKSGNVVEVMRPDGKGVGRFLEQGKSDTIEAVRDGMLFYRTTDDAGNTLIRYSNLHDFLMGDENKTFGDSKYRAEQEKLAEQNSPLALSQMSGTLLSAKSVSDYTAMYCFRPYGDQSNLVYMLGFKSSGVELRSSIALATGSNDESSEKTITVYNAGATLLNVEGDYMYFTDTDASVIFRTRWNKEVADKTQDEIKEQISHDDVTSTNFNGDYCAGYIVYTGKVDEWADGYTFFKLVDRIDGAEKVFVGKKIDGDLKPEEDEDEDEEDDENKEENE